MQTTMEAPANRQSRLSDDVWLAGEALKRWMGMSTPRDGFEMAVRNHVMELAKSNSEFSQIWNEVKAEGLTDKGRKRTK